MRNTCTSVCLGLVLFLVTILFAACGDSRIATGVLLWPPDGMSEAHGAVVPILEANRNTGTFLIRTEGGEPFLIEQFRVERFDTPDEANAFARSFEQFAFLYAESQQRALPVRRSQSTDSQSVYRFREGEILKIIGPPSDEVVISGLRGRWHPVLTEAGVRGYTFDFALILFDEREGIADEARTRELPAQAITVIENVWRPNEFHELISAGSPSLERLNPEFGLFPDHAQNTVRIVTDDVRADFLYESIVSSGASHIRFEGSSLVVRIDGSNQITAFFTVDGVDYTRRFRLLSTDLETVIEREEQRRERSLEIMHADGRLLQSSAYGTIAVSEAGRFSWSGYELLVPGVLSPAYGNQGTIQFRHYLGPAVRNQYDGVVSFVFDGAPSGDYVSFLYEVEAGGIRLTHAPRNTFDDLQIIRSDASPVVIFFSFLEPEEASADADL